MVSIVACSSSKEILSPAKATSKTRRGNAAGPALVDLLLKNIVNPALIDLLLENIVTLLWGSKDFSLLVISCNDMSSAQK